MSKNSISHYLSRHIVIALASLGGALEMYDFVIYIFFAKSISALFFPSNDLLVSKLLTFSVFALGYLVRPIGGLVFGHYGDRYGRKKGLLLTIVIMASAMLMMALMPSYQTIGVTASVMFVLLRLVQGFALGGDLPGAITYISECAEYKRRGFFIGVLFLFVNFGMMLASSVGVIITAVFSESEVLLWGWRLAFLFGAVLFVIAGYFRYKNIESPAFTRLKQQEKLHRVPVLTLIKNHNKKIIMGTIIAALHGFVVVQLFLYMPIYLQHATMLTAHTSSIYNTLNLAIFSLLIPFFAGVSDRHGRKLILGCASCFLLLFSYLLYMLIDTAIPPYILCSMLLFGVSAAAVVSVVPVLLAEFFPASVRNSGVGLCYNVGFGVFGGLAPVMSALLVHYFNSPSAPSITISISAFFVLLILYRLRKQHFSTQQF